MRNVLKIAVLLLVFVASASTMQAQKFGYVNSSEILAEFPKVKQANANIESFQKVLEKQYKQMLEGFQQKYAVIQQKAANGELSPKQQEEEATKLREEETKIARFEQESQQKLVKKQEELLQPIMNEINEAIKQVAKEKGLQMVFEASVLLYSDDTADISTAVKSKLGM